MAELKCNNDNNNPNSSTSLELNLLGTNEDGLWLNYEIVFNIGKDSYNFKSHDRKAITYTGIEAEIGKFAFALKPNNELQTMLDGINKLLKQEINKFIFEPADPSFELIIEPTTTAEDFKVYCWIDAGNTQQLEYTWDGLGIRFVTDITNIKNFCQSLELELSGPTITT